MWSRIQPRCATLLGKSIAVAFSNSRSPREYEFATDSFNMVYILVGFIYLSLVIIRERPPEDETAFLEGHHRIPHDWISLLFFALFADNLVRWWEGAEGSYWFWLLSGQIEAVLIFAGLSVADLFLYWSRIGPILDESE